MDGLNVTAYSKQNDRSLKKCGFTWKQRLKTCSVALWGFH